MNSKLQRVWPSKSLLVPELPDNRSVPMNPAYFILGGVLFKGLGFGNWHAEFSYTMPIIIYTPTEWRY